MRAQTFSIHFTPIPLRHILNSVDYY